MFVGVELQELIVRIAKRWPFNKENYPRIPDTEEGRREFAIGHIQKHLAHESGKLARILEQGEHSFQFDRHLNNPAIREDLLSVVRDLLIGTLRLSEVLGISPEEIDKALEKYFYSVYPSCKG